MTVYLVQHGRSVPQEEDPQRPLSQNGRQEVEKIARGLKKYDLKISKICHSGKVRAIQTAHILQQQLNTPQGTIELEGMKPNDDVRLFAENIARVDNVMYVGHLPFMEKLVSYLVTGDEGKMIFKFQNAGIIKLQYSDDTRHWFIAGSFLPRPV